MFERLSKKKRDLEEENDQLLAKLMSSEETPKSDSDYQIVDLRGRGITNKDGKEVIFGVWHKSPQAFVAPEDKEGRARSGWASWSDFTDWVVHCMKSREHGIYSQALSKMYSILKQDQPGWLWP